MVFSVEKIINGALLFFIGLGLGMALFYFILGGSNISDYRETIDSLRIELELADQALVRSQSRVISIKGKIDDSITGLDKIGFGLDGVEDLARSSLGILGEVRKTGESR